jgi:hypothetical protein
MKCRTLLESTAEKERRGGGTTLIRKRNLFLLPEKTSDILVECKREGKNIFVTGKKNG